MMEPQFLSQCRDLLHLHWVSVKSRSRPEWPLSFIVDTSVFVLLYLLCRNQKKASRKCLRLLLPFICCVTYFAFCKRKAFSTTDSELSDIATAANIGVNNKPVNG